MLIDVTRLVRRFLWNALSGVDRVALAYARRYVVEGDGEACLCIRSQLVALPRPAALRFVGQVSSIWRDSDGRRHNEGLARFEAAAGASPFGEGLADATRDACQTRRAGRQLLTAAAAALLRQAVALPDRRRRARVYVNVAHSGLDRPRALGHLFGRNGLRPAIFIHDLIPITHAEFFRPGDEDAHRKRMRTALTFAERLIVNSNTTRVELDRWAGAQGLRTPTTTVAPLGVEAGFFSTVEPLPARRPYFVCLATIEARKNHLLLLNIWRAMAEEMGELTPILALVGRRGWESEQVHDMIERCRPLADHVFEISNLGDDYLSRLIKGSRALLFPSFVEGYGLPLLEAAALGAPAIASDIPAFREIAGGAAEMIDPLDGVGWRAAIEAYGQSKSARRDRQIEALSRAPAPTSWNDHFAIADPILADLERGTA